tara:strand:- start:338 stop:1735 length:1398 start_codon:yes stop_codon:yes gene_type:complete
MVREMNHFIEEAKDQGFTDMAKLNQMVTHQIANQAVLYEDKSILDFISHIETAGGNNYGNTLYAQDLVRKVGSQIDRKKEADESWRWKLEDRRLLDRDRGLSLEVGEFYNNKNLPPEEQQKIQFNEKVAWEALRSKLYSAGKIDIVKKIEDRKFNLKERRTKGNQIEIEDILENDELAKELFEMANNDEGALYRYSMTEQQISKEALEYLIHGREEITPYHGLEDFKRGYNGISSVLKNITKQKVIDSLGATLDNYLQQGGQLENKVPSEALALISGFLQEYADEAELAYNTIARDKEGRRTWKNWTKDQKRAWTDLLDISNYQDKNREDSIAKLLRRADKEINEAMEKHLTSGPNNVKLNVENIQLQGKITDKWKFLTGDKPEGTKSARDLYREAERLETIFYANKETIDPFIEDLIEDTDGGVGLDIDDYKEMTREQRVSIETWFDRLYAEIDEMKLAEGNNK